MDRVKKAEFGVLLALLAICSSVPETTCAAAGPDAAYSEYAGIYLHGPLEVLEVGAVDDYLSVVPPFWGSKPYFVKDGAETFSMALPRPEPGRTVSFERSADGTVEALLMSGVDDSYDGKRFVRSTKEGLTPGQLFLARKPHEAAKAVLADSSLTADDLYRFAFQHLLRHPSRQSDAAVFLQDLLVAHPKHAKLSALYAYSLVAAGRRSEAPAALEIALRLDPQNSIAQETYRRLTQREPPLGEGYRAVLPFSLQEAYAPPTREEIRTVRRAWAERDLSAKDVEVVQEFQLKIPQASFHVAMLRHQVDGNEHYGAVLIPEGAAGPLPVVVAARGVDFYYSPLDISEGVETTTALGDAASNFMYLIPCMRGNTIIVNGMEFSSGGDASDAWDGATDDTLAFLNAALETFPQADQRRIAIVGKSRGGSVALLAGERDRRISLVQSISGPTDHFKAMNPFYGWSWAVVLADDMRDEEPPSMEERDESSQVFDHFFDRALTENENLEDVRQRMLASSALYFLENLPRTDAYYGAEDRAVPLANAIRLRERDAALGNSGPDLTVHIFDGRGHDTDPYLVNQSIKKRLVRWAGVSAR